MSRDFVWPPRSVAGVVLWLVAASAQGATITVNGTADENSSSPPNAVCTLREASLSANSDIPVGGCVSGTAGLDTIVVPAGHYVLTIPGVNEDLGETGDLDLYEDTQILGAGELVTVISGGGLDRVFHTSDSAAIEMLALTIDGGLTDSYGGGIFNVSASLHLLKVDIRKCTALLGGGIASFTTGAPPIPSTVHLDDVSVVANSDSGVMNGLYASMTIENSLIELSGGATAVGVFSWGGTIVRSSTVRSNAQPPTGTGGGIVVLGGSTTVEDTTIEGNGTSMGIGAGCGPGACVASLLVDRSTITKNQGVGVVAAGNPFGGYANVMVRNSTVSGNVGDGIFNASQMQLVHVTSTGNQGYQIVDGYKFGLPPLRLYNNVVQGACLVGAPTPAISFGGNVEGPGNTCGFNHIDDLTNVASVGLGPLASNGGPTQTHALTSSSPAIGSASASACLATDQRGIARPAPSGGYCDSGAFEQTGCGASLGMLPPAALLLAQRRRPRRVRPHRDGPDRA